MDANRQRWNQQHQTLQRILRRTDQHQQAIELFLSQHAMVHAAAMAQAGLWSFEDELWQGLTEPDIRRIPPKSDHSLAWLVWHMARIEDLTMNLLVAGRPQVLNEDQWQERVNVAARDSGNAMDTAAVAVFSANVNVEALRAYRMAVGRRTREIVRPLKPEDLKRKVEPARLQRVLTEGAVDAAWGLIDYWGKRDIAGLLMMPATRHNFVHLNEAMRLKPKG